MHCFHFSQNRHSTVQYATASAFLPFLLTLHTFTPRLTQHAFCLPTYTALPPLCACPTLSSVAPCVSFPMALGFLLLERPLHKRDPPALLPDCPAQCWASPFCAFLQCRPIPCSAYHTAGCVKNGRMLQGSGQRAARSAISGLAGPLAGVPPARYCRLALPAGLPKGWGVAAMWSASRSGTSR